VEVFEVLGHPRIPKVYAWSHEVEGQGKANRQSKARWHSRSQVRPLRSTGIIETMHRKSLTFGQFERSIRKSMLESMVKSDHLPLSSRHFAITLP
jgi:hypothetical protein